MLTWKLARQCALSACIGTCVTAPALAESRGPTLFFSCRAECYEDFLRQELSHFDVVRDRYLADVNLVISRQLTGDGGQRMSVRAVWTPGAHARFRVAEGDHEAFFLVQPGQPAEETRAALSQAVLRVLYSSLDGTNQGEVFRLSVPPRDAEELSHLHDAWNYLVVAPEVGIGGEGASEYHFVEGFASLTIRRTTEPWRLRMRGAYEVDWNSVVLEDGSRISAAVPSWEGRALSVHSLGRRWAAGGLFTIAGGDYENYELHLHGGPGLEYNIFPYADNAERQLRFVYQAGVWYNRYLEESVAGLFEEVRPYHALSIIADVNQRWGSIQWAVQGNQFLSDFESYRVATSMVVSLGLTTGLAFNIEGTVAWVQDQINLRNRPATDEELLLWTVEQPTTFTFEGNASLAYTFGSRHDSIVNPRFGRVDLQED